MDLMKPFALSKFATFWTSPFVVPLATFLLAPVLDHSITTMCCDETRPCTT
eukprot:CAMPEP_0170184372 /NCGR_PEP_ID=MMETSP0040_2-20121228/33471_1 /TAXON_ID=641309 /ORGANISM="Lotharella oceanica, Strain CCMP622" /LENGTH=50 /DNA_ID=CAMNT_0010430425 /DNA_START=18 /DNA_END=167 /DNA_ORIENTATION=-